MGHGGRGQAEFLRESLDGQFLLCEQGDDLESIRVGQGLEELHEAVELRRAPLAHGYHIDLYMSK